jgi:hypothetical protein
VSRACGKVYELLAARFLGEGFGIGSFEGLGFVLKLSMFRLHGFELQVYSVGFRI